MLINVGFTVSRSGYSYTQEKICNFNDHCSDDCNSSLEWSDLTHERKFVIWMIIVMMIAIRVRINTCVHKHKGHVSSASQKMFWMFSHTHAKFAL